MAQSKGGKKDPMMSKRDETDTRLLVKLSQIKKIIKARTKHRSSKGACIALSACLVYTMGEILEGAKACADHESKKKILPKHINGALGKDDEIYVFTTRWLLRGGGVRNTIPTELLSKKNKHSQDMM